MGSWVRAITSPFRKACTIVSPQSRDQHVKKTRHQSSGIHPSMAHGGDVERSQLYGEVMACAYEDVQVMWSMLDNKARICNATS